MIRWFSHSCARIWTRKTRRRRGRRTKRRRKTKREKKRRSIREGVLVQAQRRRRRNTGMWGDCWKLKWGTFTCYQSIGAKGFIIYYSLWSVFRSHSRDESSTDTKSRSHHVPGYGLQVSEQQSTISYTTFYHAFTTPVVHLALPSQVPAGRHHQSSGRRERSRSRSPHRNRQEGHAHSSSSHRGDGKDEPKASSQQRDRYQRQKHPVAK